MFVDRDASWSIYAWICTTRLQPPHATYVAWKWLAYITHCHTSCLDIIVISIKTSRQSQNLQNWRKNLSADWKCMDNLILSWFFSLQFLVLAKNLFPTCLCFVGWSGLLAPSTFECSKMVSEHTLHFDTFCHAVILVEVVDVHGHLSKKYSSQGHFVLPF